MAAKFTAQQLLDRAHVWLMRQNEFIGLSGIIMTGKCEISDDKEKCPTAYTDGYNVVYGRQFIESLTEPEVRFVIAHENYHKMYRHTVTWRHLYRQAPLLANVAADYVINGHIMMANCSGIAMPKGACFDQKYSDGTKDVGEVFRELCKEYPHLASPQVFVIGDGSGQKNGKGSGPLPEGFDQHDWEKAETWSADELRDQAEKIDQAIRHGAVLAGRVAGGAARDFGELLKVKTDYREIMRQFFQSSCQGDGELSYSRPNRRMLQHDVIFPTEICETLPHVVIGIDTSGSIGGEILTNFLSNVAHMLKQVNPEKVDLLYWDTEVAGHETYEQGEVDKLVASTKPAGGGGTSPACVSRWLEKNQVKPTCLVMLTDGYVDGWPKEMCPTIWCIYENDHAAPPYGTVAHI